MALLSVSCFTLGLVLSCRGARPGEVALSAVALSAAASETSGDSASGALSASEVSSSSSSPHPASTSSAGGGGPEDRRPAGGLDGSGEASFWWDAGAGTLDTAGSAAASVADVVVEPAFSLGGDVMGLSGVDAKLDSEPDGVVEFAPPTDGDVAASPGFAETGSELSVDGLEERRLRDGWGEEVLADFPVLLSAGGELVAALAGGFERFCLSRCLAPDARFERLDDFFAPLFERDEGCAAPEVSAVAVGGLGGGSGVGETVASDPVSSPQSSSIASVGGGREVKVPGLPDGNGEEEVIDDASLSVRCLEPPSGCCMVAYPLAAPAPPLGTLPR